MKAMTAVQKVKDSLLQPKIKVKVVNEIKEKDTSFYRMAEVDHEPSGRKRSK